MNNIFVLDKNYNKIGTLSNQGVKPLAPYFNDLFVQDLETGADTYEFSTISNSYTQGCIEIGNHIMFAYRNRNELFTITSIEHSHSEGYKTVGVYAESVGFELLDIYMEKPKVSETDKDDDDDSNKDNGGSDKVYIDENGNIIYDPDGDGSTGGDITIDGNGNIIYKPKDEKKNKNSDSLEFKNISYPTFIKMILKNTGWSCVCQPGLEKNKQDIHVSYDTNIFAILQDSMQSYKGVELEFRYEYNNGKVTKTVYAYNDGGRGSFIGKRFVYGQNVKGITKTQEVTHEKDDAIIFIDDIGVEVRYDVDFALKSAEVPEIEIGDTHYVIDSDFHPPMQIKARIGKIEVSFSDPTRNKIYLANNKKMKGSLVDDGLDSYSDDDGSGGDHTHDRLVSGDDEIVYYGYDDITSQEGEPGKYGTVTIGTHNDCLESSSGTIMLSAEFKEFIDYKDKKLTAIRTKYDPKLYIYKNSYPNKALVFTDRGEMIPNYDNYSESHLEKYYHGLYNIGTPESRWRAIYLRKIWACDVTNSPRYYGYNYQVHFDRDQMNNVKRITNSSTITKQDLLDFIMDKVKVYEYSSKVIDELLNVDEGDYGSQMYLGLLSDDMVTKKSNSDWSTSKLASRIVRGVVTADTNNDGETTEDDLTTYFVYNLPALVCALIGAFQQHVATGGGSSGKVFDDDVDIDFDDNDPNDKEDSGGSGGSGGSGSSGGSGGGSGNISGGFIEAERIDVEGEVNVFGELYVTEKIKCELTTETNTLKVNKIEFSDGSKMITAGTGDGNTPGPGNYATVEYVDSQVGAVLELKPAIIDFIELKPAIIDFIELKPAIIDFIELKPAIIDLIENGSGDSGGGSIFQKVSDRFYYTDNDIQIERDLYVNGTLHINSGDGMGMGIVDCDILKVVEIQFANGTKLPVNNIATVSELSEYATVEALQEEVRIKDEQIANLEARLARLEALLDNNNN